MIHVVSYLILVWIILLLGRSLYQNGVSPVFVVVDESMKVVGKVFKPVIRLGVTAATKGGKGLLAAAMKLFRK